ncbi:MAG TPA: hypothetical protein VK172_02670 [Lentimicrobium sp.]|nr:hypothetical protein [Lentimicrobium sp.]
MWFKNISGNTLLKTALLCMAVFALLSISCKRKISSFSVTVGNKGLEYPVRLLRVDTSGVKYIDSLLIPAKGPFQFIVQCEHEYAYFLESGNRQAVFMAGAGDSVCADFEKKQIITRENKRYAQFREYFNQVSKLETQADSLALLFNSAQLTDSFPQVRERLNNNFKTLLLQARLAAEDFVKNDSTPAIFIAITARLRQSVVLNYVTNPQIFEYADSLFKSNHPEHPYGIWLNNFVSYNKLKYGDLLKPNARLKEGQAIHLIQLPGMNNKTVTIAPARGQTALIYFWDESKASRNATASIRLLNEQYKSAGLTIYAIAFMEKKRDWPSLIEVDKMWWTNMIDARSVNSPLLTEFNITRLPYFIVINDERKVIAHFGNAAELSEWATTHFNKR